MRATNKMSVIAGSGKAMKILFALAVASLLMAQSASAAYLNVTMTPQQNSSWCWAASSQAVLRFYGIVKTQAQVASVVPTAPYPFPADSVRVMLQRNGLTSRLVMGIIPEAQLRAACLPHASPLPMVKRRTSGPEGMKDQPDMKGFSLNTAAGLPKAASLDSQAETCGGSMP